MSRSYKKTYKIKIEKIKMWVAPFQKYNFIKIIGSAAPQTKTMQLPTFLYLKVIPLGSLLFTSTKKFGFSLFLSFEITFHFYFYVSQLDLAFVLALSFFLLSAAYWNYLGL